MDLNLKYKSGRFKKNMLDLLVMKKMATQSKTKGMKLNLRMTCMVNI